MHDDSIQSGLTATINADGSAVLTVDETPQRISTERIEDARREIVTRVAQIAQMLDMTMPVTVFEPDGVWPLLVHPDGQVESAAEEEVEEDEPEATEPPAPITEPPGTPISRESLPDNEPVEEQSGIEVLDGLIAEVDDTDTLPASVPARPIDPPAALPVDETPAQPVSPTVPEASPVTAEPEPEPEPTVPVPAPAPVQPEPVLAPVEPEPEPAVPEPVLAVAEPAAPEPEIVPAVPAPVSTVPEPEPEPVGPEPVAGPVTAEPAPVVPEPVAAPVMAAPVIAAPVMAAPVHAAPATEEPMVTPLHGLADPPSGMRRSSAAAPVAPGRRSSFLSHSGREEPADRGWRGALNRTGMRVSPNRAERAERADQAIVAQHWGGPRTIAIVNGKGGSGKTPTSILTAAVFARFGGAGVLAWDNNQTRGTLGWRTEQGAHEATLHELLPQIDHLLSAQAKAADLANFVHHQTRDRFDVLRSQPLALANQQRVSGEEVDRIHRLATKYYRLVVMDSGNDESDPLWLKMIDKADQIVLATTTRAEHAEAGALLLEALAERDERSAQLAQNAVTVVNKADPRMNAAEVRHVVDGFAGITREVVTIPYDPAMADGMLHLGALRPATQRAWIAAGAAIARGLSQPAG